MSREPVAQQFGEPIGSVEHDEGHPAPSKPMEILIPVVALVFMGALLFLSLNLELRREPAPGQIDARFWPTLLAVAGIILAVWRLAVVLLGPPVLRDDLERVERGGMTRLIITVALTLAFIGLWSMNSVILFGYRINLFVFISTFFVAALVYLFGFVSWRKSWRSVVIFPVVVSVGIYLLFGTLLRIPL